MEIGEDITSTRSGEIVNAETQSVLSQINNQRAGRLAKLAHSRTGRLGMMLAMTSAFFFVEIVVGYTTNSLSLVADSFHMLSDIVSLCIGLYAVRVAKRSAFGQHTFGFVRAEVLGALVNAVFLLALVFSIIVEAINRFFQVEPIEKTVLLLWVGGTGLFINLLGLLLFASGHGHGHSHGGHGHGHGHGHGGEKKVKAAAEEEDVEKGEGHGHGHSHGDEHAESTAVKKDAKKRRRWFGHGHSHGGHGHGHGKKAKEEEEKKKKHEEEEEGKCHDHAHGENGHAHAHGDEDGHSHHSHGDEEEDKHVKDAGGKKKGKMSGMNMHGVFLHILGDALGSVVVIIGALVVHLTEWEGRYYVDPALSLLISAILSFSAIPLVKSTAQVLLQYAPVSVDVDALRAAIVKTPGVLDCHELHIWSLSDNKIIASVHVTCSDTSDQMVLGLLLKELFHSFDIHSVTIQQEIPPQGQTLTDGTACLLTCNTIECNENACCPVPMDRLKSVSFATRPIDMDALVSPAAVPAAPATGVEMQTQGEGSEGRQGSVRVCVV